MLKSFNTYAKDPAASVAGSAFGIANGLPVSPARILATTRSTDSGPSATLRYPGAIDVDALLAEEGKLALVVQTVARFNALSKAVDGMRTSIQGGFKTSSAFDVAAKNLTDDPTVRQLHNAFASADNQIYMAEITQQLKMFREALFSASNSIANMKIFVDNNQLSGKITPVQRALKAKPPLLASFWNAWTALEAIRIPLNEKRDELLRGYYDDQSYDKPSSSSSSSLSSSPSFSLPSPPPPRGTVLRAELDAAQLWYHPQAIQLSFTIMDAWRRVPLHAEAFLTIWLLLANETAARYAGAGQAAARKDALVRLEQYMLGRDNTNPLDPSSTAAAAAAAVMPSSTPLSPSPLSSSSGVSPLSSTSTSAAPSPLSTSTPNVLTATSSFPSSQSSPSSFAPGVPQPSTSKRQPTVLKRSGVNLESTWSEIDDDTPLDLEKEKDKEKEEEEEEEEEETNNSTGEEFLLLLESPRVQPIGATNDPVSIKGTTLENLTPIFVAAAKARVDYPSEIQEAWRRTNAAIVSFVQSNPPEQVIELVAKWEHSAVRRLVVEWTRLMKNPSPLWFDIQPTQSMPGVPFDNNSSTALVFYINKLGIQSPKQPSNPRAPSYYSGSALSSTLTQAWPDMPSDYLLVLRQVAHLAAAIDLTYANAGAGSHLY